MSKISKPSQRDRRKANSLRRYVQDGKRTLFEVTDKEGRSWKVGSVEASKTTAYFVISGDGRVAIVSSVFVDRRRARHAIVFVDPTEQEEALAVLDRKFLSGVANTSAPYGKWLKKHAVFTLGSVENTRRIEMKKRGLGSSDVRIEENAIVGRFLNPVKCHCWEMGNWCQQYGSDGRKCLNKVCDFINCTIDIINGVRSECGGEASDMIDICRAAAQS